MSVVLLASHSGCGPGPVGEPGASASSMTMSAPAEGQRGGVPIPIPATAGSSSPPSSPVPKEEQLLVAPDWMAAALASGDVQTVETWGQSTPNGSVNPLIQALDDQDDQVRARALELIVQDWVREYRQKRGKE